MADAVLEMLEEQTHFSNRAPTLDKTHPHSVDPSVHLEGLAHLEQISNNPALTALRSLCISRAVPDSGTSFMCRSVRILNASEREQSPTLVTWRPSPSVDFVMGKTGCKTYVYFPLSDMLFQASDSSCLRAECPERTAICGQVAFDRVDDDIDVFVPQILVYDVVYVDGNSQDDVAPPVRYETLRTHLARFLPEKLNVQWCGDAGCASSLLHGSLKLPHAVDCVVAHTQKVGVLQKYLAP